MKNRNVLNALMTLIAVAFASTGGAAIVLQSHTGFARRQGLVTLEGDAAVTFGAFMVGVALLPLAVWLPRRMVGGALAVWWLLMMVVLFKFVLRLF